MKVYLPEYDPRLNQVAEVASGEQASRSFGFTFPALEVELDPELIEHCGLKEPLEKLAQVLCQKHPTVNSGKKVAGVEFQSVSFGFMLAPTGPRS